MPASPFIANTFQPPRNPPRKIPNKLYDLANHHARPCRKRVWRRTNDNSGIVLEITNLDNTRWNDKVRSISSEKNAPSGAPTSKWYFYEDSDYGGTNMVLTGDESDDNLTDNGLDKKISSIKLVLE